MSDRIYQYKPFGLRLAHQHRSAVSQTKVDKVYDRISEAFALDTNAPDVVRRQRQARAVRVILDRVQRLGERVREDYRFDPGDKRLVMQEFDFLREQAARLANDNPQLNLQEQDGSQAIDLKATPQYFVKVLDAVFTGQFKLSDRVDQVGRLIDGDANPFEIAVEGLADLVPPAERVIVDVFDTIQDLSAAGDSIQSIFDGDPRGVEKAVTAVRDAVVRSASTALHTHSPGLLMGAAKLLF